MLNHAPQPCFHLGVVAPLGFDPPGLSRFVRNKLRGLLAAKRRTHAVGGFGVWGEPVSRAATDLFQLEFGVNFGGVGGSSPYGRWVEHLRAMLRVATLAEAVVIVHPGGPLPADLRRVADACRWLRTEVRVLAFAGELVPL